ncbi:DUF4249 domain-containing protein [Flagellimonas nanhaiensis]|nr:DUF4249 domain-containing protein [Allomuricauda nanhaiensis]
MRRTSITYRCLLPVFTGCLLSSCIEPFEVTFRDFESALVIQAMITNEMKPQQILLSRTYKFEDEGLTGESGATVMVAGSNGSSFVFEEMEKGTYLSTVDFAAEEGVDYTLSIITGDGRSYSSASSKLAGEVGIDSLYARRIINDFEEEGIGIFTSSLNTNGTPNFFRFEYEETYKIIAPEWAPRELEVNEDTYPPSIYIGTRSLDERVCYATNLSNRIILTDTNDFDTGQVENFMVKFIEQNNFVTTHRYSILVRQYSHTSAAYTFLETLNSFSSSESLFSETQPGFLQGNISSEDDSSEKVLGFFDIVAVSEKRIFFGYRDFFPTERLPDYIDPCVYAAPVAGLIDLIRWDLVKFINENDGSVGGGPYITVPQVCGDCTVLGSPEMPDFWKE